MKIGFFEIEPWEKEVLKKALPKEEIIFSPEKLTVKTAEKYKQLEALAVFVHSKIDSSVLKKMPKLKLITTMSTGYDHIDLEACKQNNIKVCNVPTYGENTVAEHTFALILALSRKIVEGVERTKKGSFVLSGLRGFDLRGKTLGVVGSGNIGQHVIRMAKGFEMKVLVFDVVKNNSLAKELGFEYASMEKLLKESDLVTLHVPYNQHTHHLIGKKELSLMKKTAYLINTSRGGVLDTDALVKALQRKEIAGAGLDVLEEECEIIEEKQLLTKEFNTKCNLKTLAENHRLLEMKNVIITPHNAFNTEEALRRILEVTVENINGFKKGRSINSINR